MTGTRKTVILATAAVAVPLLDHQITAGKFFHRAVGRNEILTHCDWERGLTAAFEAMSNQKYTIKD